METYTSYIRFGSYSDKDFLITYCGNDLDLAKSKCIELCTGFEKTYGNVHGILEIWDNGEMIKSIDIYN